MNYDLSICIPTYKSAQSINILIDELFQYFSKTQLKIEIIVVCDGSPDDTDLQIQKSVNAYPDLKYISLRRNFGEYNAVMCALNHATGNFIVTMDDDFQNPPAAAESLYNKIKEGFDVVMADYNIRKMPFLRKLYSHLHFRVANVLIDNPKNIRLCTFKVFTREIGNELLKYKGPYPNLEAHILKLTKNITNHTVEHDDRKYGESSYNFNKLFDLWLNLILFSNTKIPLIVLKTGLLMFISSLLATFCCLVMDVQIHYLISLIITTLIFFIISIGGLILVYQSKIYQTSIESPQYVIKFKSFRE